MDDLTSTFAIDDSHSAFSIRYTSGRKNRVNGKVGVTAKISGVTTTSKHR